MFWNLTNLRRSKQEKNKYSIFAAVKTIVGCSKLVFLAIVSTFISITIYFRSPLFSVISITRSTLFPLPIENSGLHSIKSISELLKGGGCHTFYINCEAHLIFRCDQSIHCLSLTTILQHLYELFQTDTLQYLQNQISQ